MKSLLAALSVFAVCAAAPLHAAERVALVIGNDAYRHARPLKTAVNDSSAVAATLKSLGFDTITASNAGLEQMVDALEKLKQQSVGARAVLVYYAGHGIEAQGGNYLVPVDAKLEREIQLKTQAVSLSDVLEELKLMAVPARMVILDCCRDNPLEGRSWLETRAYGGGLATLAEDSLQEATLVVYAASPGKPALDRVSGADTHSPFTQALLDELPQPGVHSFEVFGRIEERVLRSTDSRQKPRIFYNGSTLPFRSFTFATAAAPAPTPVMPVVVQAPPAPAPMPQPAISDAPPSSQPSAPALPASGYFDLDALYLSGPYAAYNRYSRSSILVQVQKKLKAAGLYTSSADGESGPGTQRAILAYQQAHSLPLTGKLDTATLESLGLSGQSQMTPPKPAPRPQSAPSKPKPRPRPSAPSDDFFRNT